MGVCRIRNLSLMLLPGESLMKKTSIQSKLLESHAFIVSKLHNKGCKV